MDAESAEERRRDLETLVGDLKGLLLSTSGDKATDSYRDHDGDGDGDDGDDDDVDNDGNDDGGSMPVHPVAGGTPRPDGGSLSMSSSSYSAARLPTRRVVPAGDTDAVAAIAAARETAARRLLSLGEELRAAKLEASGLRRHVAGLREDRRHLERKLGAAEAASRSLEEAKAEAETRALLAGHDSGGMGQTDGGFDLGRSGDGGKVSAVGPRRVAGGGGGAGPSGGGAAGVGVGGAGEVGLSEVEQRLLVAAAMPAEVDFGGVDPEEALRRLEGAQKKVMDVSKDCSLWVACLGVWGFQVCLCKQQSVLGGSIKQMRGAA